MKTYTTKKKNKSYIFGLFWVVLWQIGAMALDKEILFPGPWATVKALWLLLQQDTFYLDCLSTIARCLVAMALSFVLGTLCAFLSYKLPVVRGLLKHPVSFFKAVPVMAIIIYMIILVASDYVSIIVCLLMCFPVVYTNLLSGLDSMDEQLLELGWIYGLSHRQVAKYILFPGILPEVKSAISLIAGLSWKAVVAAEVLSIPAHSLGYEMMNAKYYLDTPALFAYILVIILLSLGFEKMIKLTLAKVGQMEYEGSKLSFPGKQKKEAGKGPAIDIGHVAKTFDHKEALDDFSLVMEPGSVTALMGPSGIGKTTVARILAGLEKMDEGEISIQGDKSISYLFQEDRLIPWLNIYDNMAFSFLGTGVDEKTPSIIMKMAKDLEIDDVLWKLPSQLSGGMSHRVALGRTLLADANTVILDEPFRGLDADLKERIIARIWKPSLEEKTVFLISHNEEDSSKLAGKVIYM